LSARGGSSKRTSMPNFGNRGEQLSQPRPSRAKDRAVRGTLDRQGIPPVTALIGSPRMVG
jgi:hypothetical protein